MEISFFSLDGTPRNEDAKESDRSPLRWNEMEVEEQNEVAVKQQLALRALRVGLCCRWLALLPRV